MAAGESKLADPEGMQAQTQQNVLTEFLIFDASVSRRKTDPRGALCRPQHT